MAVVVCMQGCLDRVHQLPGSQRALSNSPTLQCSCGGPAHSTLQMPIRAHPPGFPYHPAA